MSGLLLNVPDDLRHVRYNGSRIPSAPGVCDLSRGANCQLYAYAFLARLGDPKRPAAVKPRLPQQAVLFREQYEVRDLDADVAAYDAAVQAFYATQGQVMAPWSQVVRERVLNAEALRGRQRLREALHRLGFALR